MKEVKIVVCDLRKEISKDLMKAYESEFVSLKMREIKRETEEVEASEVKKDPEEIFLMTYEKMPKKKEILRMEIKASRRTTTETNYQCEICQKYFSKNQSLRQHMNLHFKSSPKFECGKCRRSFERGSELEHHTCISSLSCPHCSLTLNTISCVRIHMKNVHKIQIATDGYTCDYCGDCFKTKAILLKHFKSQACRGQGKFFCDHCDKSFVSKREINSHTLSHAIYKIECKMCHSMLRPGSLKPHMRYFHPKKDEKLKCQKCLKTFKSLTNLELHLKHHNKSFQCLVCERKFINPGELKTHMKFHENPEQFRCQICEHQLTTKINLKRHLMTHDKNREKRFRCNRCDFKTHMKQSLSFHFKFHEKLDEKMKKNSNFIKCEKCHSVLKNRDNYLVHMKGRHSNRARFQCDHCEKSLVKKITMKMHLLSKHFRE